MKNVMSNALANQFRYLMGYLRPHRKVLALSLLLSIISTAVGMIQPLFAKILIDHVLLGKNYAFLMTLLGAVLLLLIVSFIIRVSNSYIYTRYSAKVLFRMREDLFAHLQKVPLTFLSKRKIGDIYSRIGSDMADIQALITDTLPGYLFNLLTCIITTGILIWLNWKMALLSFCFLPIALYMVSLIKPRILNLSKQVAETNADIGHFLFESLSGAHLIRAFGAENLEEKKLEEKHTGLLRILLRFQVTSAFTRSVPTLYTIVNTVIVFGYGGYLVIDGSLTIGSLVAFSIYQGRVFSPLQGLMDGFLTMQKAKVSLGRVREILDVRPTAIETGSVVLAGDGFNGEIAFKNVAFAYEEAEPVFKGLSFGMPPGKTTAIVGPSGVGKTTICHLMMRLFDPDKGCITLDGVDLRDIQLEWLRKQIALVSQEPFLFHSSILENIKFSNPRIDDQIAIDAAKAACIDDYIQTLSLSYQTVVGDRGVRLSGGQKQRISIARSILTKPKILILDEATAFLDHTVEERLKDTLQSLMADKTIIVISHRLSSIQNADNIIALGSKGLLYEGPADKYSAQSKSLQRS